MTHTVSHDALLVVDAQTDLLEGESAVYNAQAIREHIALVIAQARSAEVPVIFVQDDDVAPVGSLGWKIHPTLDLRDTDMRVQKAYADAFYKTSLLEILSALGVKRLVVVGCTTDACIAATCRSGVSLGFDVVLVEDAHTTFDNRFMSAAQSIEYYNVTLDGFGSEDSIGKGRREVGLKGSGDELFAP